MLLSPRSHNMFQPLSRVCCGVLSALLVLAAPVVEAAPRSKKSSRTGASKTGASKTPPVAPAAQPAPSTPEPPPAAAPAAAQPAPAAASKPAEEPARPALEKPVEKESRPAPAPRSTPVARSAPAPAAPAAPALPGRMRVGVGGDLFLEGARMSGEQGINTTRQDESFDYNSASFLSGTLWATTPVPAVSDRLRLGAGLRIFGNYSAGGGRGFGFGLLNELFISGEYGLPVADKMEVVFGGRGGLALLIPNRELAAEIRRLQEQGVSVWSVPRVGWLLGPSVGARRQMSDRIWLRADLNAQVGQQYLFATSQEISGLRFTKNWSTLGLRLGLTLGAEFSL